MSDQPATHLDQKAVRAALRAVNDPEAGMNIVDLGLVYAVEVTPDRLAVDLTMTTPACPLGDLILDDARRVLVTLVPPGTAIELRLVWDPPWSPERMSEQARRHFGWK